MRRLAWVTVVLVLVFVPGAAALARGLVTALFWFLTGGVSWY